VGVGSLLSAPIWVLFLLMCINGLLVRWWPDRPLAGDWCCCQVPLPGAVADAHARSQPGWHRLGHSWGRVWTRVSAYAARVGDGRSRPMCCIGGAVLLQAMGWSLQEAVWTLTRGARMGRDASGRRCRPYVSDNACLSVVAVCGRRAVGPYGAFRRDKRLLVLMLVTVARRAKPG
jgi:hypothetical protein